MNTIVRLIGRLVVKAPAVVLVLVLAITAVLGAFSSQQEQVTGNEGFSPDNAELQAIQTAGERFGGSTSVVQVIVDGPDAFSPEAVEAVETVTGALEASLGDRLQADPSRGGATLSYLLPLQQALGAQGIDPTTLDAAALRQAYTQGYDALPQEFRATVGALLPSDADPAQAEAGKGLVLAFVDTEGLDETEFVRTVEDAADAVVTAELPEGYEARTFAIELLFGDDSFLGEVARLFAIATGVIVVVLAFVYFVPPSGRTGLAAVLRRSGADVLLTLVGIFMAIAWMQGLGVLLGPDYLGVIGAFNPVTQIVPILLIGLGVDYAIHLTSRYREEVGAGATVRDGITGSIGTVGIALTLATITSIVGFLTNLTNPVPALRDFGILCAVGIAAAYLVMLTALPAARLLIDRVAEKRDRMPRAALGGAGEQSLGRIAGSSAVLAERLPIATLGITLVLGALGAYGLTQLETRFSFTDFVSDENPVRIAYDELTEDFGGGFGETTDVVLEGDAAEADVHNATVTALADLTDVQNVRTVGGEARVEHPVPILRQLVGALQQFAAAGAGGAGQEGAAAAGQQAAGADQEAPGAGQEAPGAGQEDSGGGVADAVDPQAVPALLAAVQQTGFDPQTGTVDEGADVAALYAAATEAAPELFASTLTRLDDGVWAARAVIQTTAGDTAAGELADAIRAAFAPVAETGVEPVVTSQNVVSAVIADEISEAQLQSLVITVGAAMLLLVLVFGFRQRRPFLGVLTVLPVGLVLLWTFGLMALFDIPFSPVTATISALAIGIGVPFTIHVANRFEEDRSRFATTEDAIRSTVTNTGGALVGSAFTTAGGFGVLAFSTLPPFRQLGIVVAIAIVASLLASILVLPSMLALWDGWHRRRGDNPSVAPGTAPATAGAEAVAATGTPGVSPDGAQRPDGNGPVPSRIPVAAGASASWWQEPSATPRAPRPGAVPEGSAPEGSAPAASALEASAPAGGRPPASRNGDARRVSVAAAAAAIATTGVVVWAVQRAVRNRR